MVQEAFLIHLSETVTLSKHVRTQLEIVMEHLPRLLLTSEDLVMLL